jgi:hypothetical protein
MKKSALVGSVILIAAMFGTVAHNANADCVEVYVDFGPLGGSKVSECIPATGEVSAFEVLNTAGFTLEGTQEYGNSVVCRVNNLPDANVETCESMPPESAYWAILVKEHQVIPMPFGLQGEWGWAQTGADEITLNPGDSIGLVFADNGDVTFP